MENPGAVSMVLGNSAAPREAETTLTVEQINAKTMKHLTAMTEKQTFKRGDVVELNEFGCEVHNSGSGTLSPGVKAVVYAWGKQVTTSSEREWLDTELNLFDSKGNFARIYGDSRMLKISDSKN